jgi:lipoprotein-anchoring transpeptidase ErfK/SrfK
MYAPGESFRVILPEEIEAISPGVEDKVITVDLGRQELSAMEAGVEVYYARISSGYAIDEEGRLHWNTPVGNNWTWRKMVSRHMSGGDWVSGYDLPGVGWTILFSGSGAAIHSTYWHNDFGTPRSRGCINVRPDDSKWLFRWSNPTVPYRPGDVTITDYSGTRVIVGE